MLFNTDSQRLRIGDGAALTRKLSYFKIIFGTSKMVKLAIPPHYCQYDVITILHFATSKNT